MSLVPQVTYITRSIYQKQSLEVSIKTMFINEKIPTLIFHKYKYQTSTYLNGLLTYVVTKVIGWIIQILEYVDISCNGAKMYLVIFIFLICVVDSIKAFFRCRGYWSILLSICCVYILLRSMFGWLCRATYCSVVSTSMLGVSHGVQNEKKLLGVYRE